MNKKHVMKKLIDNLIVAAIFPIILVIALVMIAIDIYKNGLKFEYEINSDKIMPRWVQYLLATFVYWWLLMLLLHAIGY